jgi:putative SOS response-associated peptidase YedK
LALAGGREGAQLCQCHHHANELCTELHNRMPVVLGPEAWPVWLGEEPSDLRQLKALLTPYPSDAMTCWPVSQRVGNVKNNDPSLIEPIAAA